jgi:mannosyltransferase
MHPGQPSVLYSIVAWLALSTGLPTEWALRLPSLVAMVAAAVVLHRIALRLGLPAEALLTVNVFATQPLVAFAAADARPYALALLSVLAAVLMLVRWLDSGRTSDAAGYALLASLSIYLHYLSACLIPVHAAYAVYRLRNGTTVSRWGVVVAAGLPAIFCLPLVPHVLNLWSHRVAHSFSETPDFTDFANELVPSVIVLCLACGLFAASLISGHLSWRQSQEHARRSVLLLSWYLLPITLCFAVSRLSEAKLFVGRYYLWGVPALALLVAWLIHGIEPARARRTVGLVVVLLLAGGKIIRTNHTHGREDWRGAVAAINAVAQPGTPVLFQSGFSESALGRFDELFAPGGALLAPLVAYPVAARVLAVPGGLSTATLERLEPILSRSLLPSRRFVVLTRIDHSLELWIQGRVSAQGFVARRVGDFGKVAVLVFER